MGILGREEHDIKMDKKLKKEEQSQGPTGFPQRIIRLQFYFPSPTDFVEEKDFDSIRNLIDLLIWGVIDLIFSSSFNLNPQLKEKNKNLRSKIKLKEVENKKNKEKSTQKHAAKNMTLPGKEKKTKNRKKNI